MLTIKKQLQQAKTKSDKEYLQRKCETIDRQIDKLVYELYGLTEEEIRIVEENNKKASRLPFTKGVGSGVQKLNLPS